MPNLIYNVEFKIDKSQLSGLKDIVDASTTAEVSSLTEKVEKLEGQLKKLKNAQDNVSKTDKELIQSSKSRRAELNRDIQLGRVKGKLDQDEIARIRENISVLDESSQQIFQNSLMDEKSVMSKEKLSNEYKASSVAIENATELLEQYEEQQKQTNQAVKGGAKSFSIANQTLFGFGDLAQDATQFSQGFAQGMRAIGNNIAFNSEMFGTLVQKTGGAKAAFRALGSQLLGTGGIILGINVAVMAVTSIMTHLGKKTKETQDSFEEFIGAVSGLRQVSDQDFLGIKGLEREREELEKLRQTVADTEEEERRLLNISKAYSSYLKVGAKDLEDYREENKALLDIGLDPLDERLEEVNKKIQLNNAFLDQSPLGRFTNEVKQSADSLINQFNAGLFNSSDSLEVLADSIRDTISQLQEGDADLLKAFGIDSPDEIAVVINDLKDELSTLEDLFPPEKPVIENIIPEDAVILDDLDSLESMISDTMTQIKADMDALFTEPFSGSIAAEQQELKRLQQTFNQVTNQQERDRLRVQIENQQARVDAMRDGLQDLDMNELIGDFDPDNLPIIGEDNIFEEEAKEQQARLKQISKDGVASRVKDAKDEMDATIIAEKGKQAARELGVQGAQAVSQAIQGLFGESKEIAIAETIISTYFAAQKAFESQMLIPSPDAPVRANIAAAVAVAQGLARVAAIRNTDKSGGGGGGGGGRSGGGGGGIGSRSRASGLFGTTDTASGSALNNQPLFTPNASEKNRGITVMVNNTFDDRTVASVASNGNDQRREGAVSGLG